MPEDRKENLATICFLHVDQHQEGLLFSLINRIWFVHDLVKITTRDQQHLLFQELIYRSKPAPFQLLIATLGGESPLDPRLQTHLMLYLRQVRCPLISLGNCKSIEIIDQDPNWLHIALPKHITAANLEEANNAMANFWFHLPSL